MKLLKYLLILLFSINSYSQDTLYTAKSIYKRNAVVGYVVAKITPDTIIFVRVNKYSKLHKSIHWKKKYGLYIKHYPKKLLYFNEKYQENLRSNKI